MKNIIIWRRTSSHTIAFGKDPSYSICEPVTGDMLWADPIGCTIPNGYEVSESSDGDLQVYGPDGTHCPIIDVGGNPHIIINGENSAHMTTIRLNPTPLKEHISNRNMTIAQFAEKIGMSPRTLEGYTSGRRSLHAVSAATVSKIANGLNLSVDELLSDIT